MNQESLYTPGYLQNQLTPTSTYMLHHATGQFKRAILYGQPVKIKRICSDEEDLQQKLNNLESWLTDRGYRAEVARPEIQKVNSINRNVMLEKNPKISGGQCYIDTYIPSTIACSF